MMKTLFNILYIIWIWTWGFVESFIGLIVFLYAIIFRHGIIYKNGYGVLVTFGGNWGGLSLGMFQFCGQYEQLHGPCYNLNWFEHTRKHEFGHSLQVCIFGPIWIFIVGIPSIFRYWYSMKHETSNEWYDSVWFEGTATRWGTKTVDKLEPVL